MEQITNWSELKEYARKHPETDMAELAIWNNKNVVITPKFETGRYHYGCQILKKGYDHLTSEATKVLQGYGFDIMLCPNSDRHAKMELFYSGGYTEFREYRDAVTGVHYLMYSGVNGEAGGMTVRYNADGTVYVD